MQRITPFLRFDTQAEEAARLYTSIFPKSGAFRRQAQVLGRFKVQVKV